MKTTDKTIPPTEPMTSAPIATKGRQAAGNAKIPGSSLVPDLEKHRAAVTESHWYWLGVTPDCPAKIVTLAGLSFPIINEDVRRTPDGRTERIPRIGAVLQLTREHILRIRERLARTVVRFIEDKGTHVEPGSGQNLGDPIERPRKGYVITIPRDEDIKARRDAGFSIQPYVQMPGDEPAARYLFAVLCSNQERGSRGESYPDPLEKTGLEWPGELE